MRRAVGFTFTGGGKIPGTAPFRVSEISEGTEAAQKLLVGDEIVQVDDLKVDGTVDISALRRVIIANPAPSVTVEVRRGAQSHRVSISMRARVGVGEQFAAGERRAPLKWSAPTDAPKELTSTPLSSRSRESNWYDETEVLSFHSSTREAAKSSSMLMRRRSSSASLGSGPSISPPPLPPKSEELANGGSVHMQNQDHHITSALENGEGHANRRAPSLSRSVASGEGGAAGAWQPNSGSSRSRCGKGSASASPSSTRSSNTTMASPTGDGEGAWRDNAGGCGIEELERGLKELLDDLTAQCENADTVVIELSVLKKKMSATARLCRAFLASPLHLRHGAPVSMHVFSLTHRPLRRSISVRNGSIMDEWDNNMRIMRNELFSMCGLLAEAESDLKAAMERADELVRHVSTAIFGTAGANDDDKGGNGAVTMRREEYGAFKLELGLARQRLKRAVATCQKCILAVEDDLDSISEQVRSPGRLCPPRASSRRSDIQGHKSLRPATFTLNGLCVALARIPVCSLCYGVARTST